MDEPRWAGRPIRDLSDEQLLEVLRALRRLAMLRQRAEVWAISELLERAGPLTRPFLEAARQRAQRTDWLDLVPEPEFGELEDSLNHRDLEWDINEPLDEEIDLSSRGPLEREIVGAIRDCVHAHGPIDRNLANSAAKRVVGAIKSYNKRIRRDRIS